MRKITALFLALTLLLSMTFTAHAEEAAAVVNPLDGITTKLNADGMGGYKIGLFYLPNVEGYGKPMFDYFDWLCELTNCEPLHYEMVSFSSSDIMTAVESLVSQGADAIICIIGYSPAMFEYMNENHVYYSLMTRSYTEEVNNVVLGSEYFCGYIGDLGGAGGIEFLKGYGVAEVLANQGCKNIAILAMSEGETMNDERVAGQKQAAEDFGMNVVAVYRGSDISTGTADILASYGSELDGICTAGADATIAAIAAWDMSKVGEIKVVSIDAPAEPLEYLEEGYVSAFTNEGAGFLALMYMQMFNAMSGADRLYLENYIVPQFPGMVIASVDQWNQMAEVNDLVNGCFTPNEILALNSKILPGLTVAEREAMLTSWCTTEYWNIESIYARCKEYSEMN